MTLIQDVTANSPFMLSTYGNNLALGFKGESSFIYRCFNWAVNTGVIGLGAQLNWYYERETGRLAYVCPKNQAAILAGLMLQFRAEIIGAKEIAPIEDLYDDDNGPILVLDEEKIDALASQRASKFMIDHVIRDSFMLNRPASMGNVYSVSESRNSEES